MAEPAETLEADCSSPRAWRCEDEGWTLRLWTYDRDRNKVETDVVTGRSPKDAKFQKAARRAAGAAGCGSWPASAPNSR